jgi:hypothetical protein
MVPSVSSSPSYSSSSFLPIHSQSSTFTLTPRNSSRSATRVKELILNLVTLIRPQTSHENRHSQSRKCSGFINLVASNRLFEREGGRGANDTESLGILLGNP